MSTVKPDAVTSRAIALLIEFRDKLRYREPDGDHEYCKACGHSPYWHPQHAPDCIVPRLLAFLRDK